MSTADSSPAGDILVVDDTAANLKLLTDILTGAGYRTRPASNGELALRSVRARRPGLILLDIRMPGMDGFEVCRRLKADATTRDIPVIFLSALTEIADKAKGFELGAVDYVAKPFEPREVLARIGTHLALSAANEQFKTQNIHLQRTNEQLTREIAERKRAEEALRESRDRLNGIYLSVGDGIVSVDEDQRIVLFNSAAERIFEHSAASVIGRSLSVLLPERFRTPHEQHVRIFDATGKANRMMGTYGQIYGLRASGEEFPVDATVSQSGISPNKLFTVILRDITERRQAEQVREQLLKRLELLSGRLATAQEEERGKIAYELHEELGQELAILKIHLQLMEKDYRGKTHLREALTIAELALERVRSMSLNLRPPQLDDFGLYVALRAHCTKQADAVGWTLHFDDPEPGERPHPDVELACFRVAQQALVNVAQHANATEVWVTLHKSGDELQLRIRDNGVGFDVGEIRGRTEQPALGLIAMEGRAKLAGGHVEISSSSGGGTEIRAVFPRVVSSG
jgi:PAS domain S-box-containing protein